VLSSAFFLRLASCYLSFFGMFMDKKAAPARVGLSVTVCLTQAALQIPVATYVPVNQEGTWTLQSSAMSAAFLALLEYLIVNNLMTRRKQKLGCMLLLFAKCLAWSPFGMCDTADEPVKDPVPQGSGIEMGNSAESASEQPVDAAPEQGVGIGTQASEPEPEPTAADVARDLEIWCRGIYGFGWTLFLGATIAAIPS
jgi:hypothetical protein